MTEPAPAPAGDTTDDEEEEKPRRRSPWRTFKLVMRRLVTRPLVWLACVLVPRIYAAYMWFVWKTSKLEDHGFSGIEGVAQKHDGFVGMLWHEEVFSVAWAYRPFHAHTLASMGDAGEVITRMLLYCNFVVFRGGSSSKKSRRSEHILRSMIDHMKNNRDVRYGITVDGSKGPYHVIKKGAIVIARECNKPMIIVRTWAKRNIHLPTWDRMAIPLPFNHIRLYMRGPYFLPEGLESPEKLEEFRLKMQQDLNDLAAESLKW